uniref:RWD domain-containing protein n=1 Tax=Trichuris muris TaxID=70415 RepID=A0A5S6QMJ5_TRIMR
MSVAECLRAQLEELCALESIFSGSGEVQVAEDVLNSIRRYVAANGCIPETPPPLDITFRLHNVDTIGQMEVQVELPLSYPFSTCPSVFVRCQTLSGNQASALNTSLRDHIAKEFCRSPILYEILLWLGENAKPLVDTARVERPLINAGPSGQRPFNSLSRFWIYSHHIYNKDKRKGILATSKELNLSGFCLPGKPGIVCVEGLISDCQTFWERIRGWTWKRILLKHQEIAALDAEESLEAQGKRKGGAHGPW